MGQSQMELVPLHDGRAGGGRGVEPVNHESAESRLAGTERRQMRAVVGPLARFRMRGNGIAGRLAAEHTRHRPGNEPGLQSRFGADGDQIGHRAWIPTEIGLRHDVHDDGGPGLSDGAHVCAGMVRVAIAKIAHGEAYRFPVTHG